MQINELFDRAYPIKREGPAEYSFQTQNGRTFQVAFQLAHHAGIGRDYTSLRIGFGEMGEDPTDEPVDRPSNRGDAFRIYATVKKAIQTKLDELSRQDIEPKFIFLESYIEEKKVLRVYEKFAKQMGLPGYKFDAEYMAYDDGVQYYRYRLRKIEESKQLDELKFSQAREIKKGQLTPGVLLRKLENWGYDIVGTGSYSEVWAKPDSDIVVKVSTRKPDPCWHQFADLAQKMKKVQNNKHFPKVGKLHWIETGGKKYFVAFIEKLQPIHKALDGKTQMHLKDVFSTLHEAMMEGKEAVRIVLFKEGDPERIDLTDELVESVHEILPESLRRAIWAVYVRMPKNCLGDFHVGNLMVRPSTGDLVLIDPWMEGR